MSFLIVYHIFCILIANYIVQPSSVSSTGSNIFDDYTLLPRVLAEPVPLGRHCHRHRHCHHVKTVNLALFNSPQIHPQSLNKTRNPAPEGNNSEIGETLGPGRGLHSRSDPCYGRLNLKPPSQRKYRFNNN